MSKTGPIIIIEDEEREIGLYQAILPLKNKVIYFRNGRTALDYLETTKDDPFIIICDINMPVMDGLDLRERINSNPYLKKKATPFVFRTASATRLNFKKSYDLNVQGFFKKNHAHAEDEKQINLIIDYWQENSIEEEL
ncbi:MAG: response regulator [Bacteroidota bacterium]